MSENRDIRFIQTMQVLEVLQKESKFTRELLQELGDFRKHAIVKDCMAKGFIKREKKGKHVYNTLTEKGRDILTKYRKLRDAIES